MRHVYLIAGFVALALGAIGAVLPLLPTVPFLILAAFCFARSNPEFEAYLLDHPQFGEAIRTWRTRGAISRKGKKAATIAFGISLGLAFLLMDMPWPLVSVVAIGLTGTWIWTRPDA
ncbi:YbaN family protein [Aquisediminimonas sediminicola]|uniref:YbaN family protein n=1 Tax=Alteraquisediminimonas sediminicola TaxID=2676787 RepID=UPI001C8F09B4|nr:YbaN family protein [Aquisediminimonas sediminicola]